MLDSSGMDGLTLFSLSALETLFPPLAGPVLPLAGVAVSRGEAGLLGSIAVSTAGSTAGSLLLYLGSRWFGAHRVRSWLLGNSKWSRLSVEHFERAESWFERNATLAVLLGRCVPVMRSLVSIPAGLIRMRIPRFVILSLLGNALWCALVVAVSAQLGDRLAFLQGPSRWLQVAVAGVWWVLITTALVVWFVRRNRIRSTPRSPGNVAGDAVAARRERDPQ